MKTFPSLTSILSGLVFLAGAALTPLVQAQTGNANIWFGPGAGITNWSTGNNWTNATIGGTAGLVGGDDVKFFDAGASTTASNINNVVDVNLTIGSLQYGNTNLSHTTLIAPGVTLAVTNAGGLLAMTPTDVGVLKVLTNYITGVAGTLQLTNAKAPLAVNQGGATSSSREVLDISGLGVLSANILKIGVGTTTSPNPGGSANKTAGVLYLAQTNIITLNLTDTLANYQLGSRTNAIEISNSPGNNAGVASFIYLGQTNSIYLDSVGIGRNKNNSTTYGWLGFNPAFLVNNPVAYFRGVSGAGSRVTWWAIGDSAASASSSNGGFGTNDFSGGTVDAMVNVLLLARDAASASDTWAGPHKGTLTFNSGIIDANTVLVGDQTLETGTSTTASLGVINVGTNATLRINTGLTFGFTTLTGVAGQNTSGILSVNGGTVLANNITVGISSVTNRIFLTNATLIVSNTLATNAAGLFSFSMTNSTLGLTVTANGSLRGLFKTLNTGGSTNLIALNSAPVIFSSYPQQIPLVKYTTWTGTNNFGLATVPAWAPGATLVSNGPNSSLDLLLPTDPRPVFTAQPVSYSGSPGDNVPTNFSVIIAAGSVTPLGYQWYFVTNGVTNLLTDGVGPSGSSTLSGSTSANLQITSAQVADSGNYLVVVTNLYGTNTSSSALLTISGTPIAPVAGGPANVNATNSLTTVIAGSASGSPVPSFYWQYTGVSGTVNLTDGVGPSGNSTLSGTASSTLTIVNPQHPGDDGTYSLIASNSAGLSTNNTVLTVYIPPSIATQPSSLVVTNTQSASFTVVASGFPAPAYQWNKNGTPISSALNHSATNATFSIGSVSANDTATYTVTVTNAAGTTNSVAVTLTVNSTMLASTLLPANGATGISYDTPVYVTFSQAPVLNTQGKIKIFNVTNSTTPVDTLDLSQGPLQGRLIATETFANYPVIITGNTAAIYPHLDLLTSNQTYYITIDDGVFADTSGAYFAGIAANTWQFTTKVGGPANPTNIVVAQDYSGDFATVQGALDSLPANNTVSALINVRNGVYTEIVEFKKSNIIVRGQSRSGTIIGYANNSNLNPSTHSRMAMKVNANNISLDNLTVTNSTAQDLSQAEALMIESAAQNLVVNNCNIDSYQDTILANVSTSKAYFNRSLIQGDVDFIWGGGNLFFTNCEIRYLIRAGNGAALGPNPSPSTTDISSNGFSFVSCALTTLPGANPNDTVGRTRSITNGNTALINCFVSTNISGWSADALPVTAFRNWYSGCTNDMGASVTLSNGIALSPTDPNTLLAGNAVAWLYGWNPALAPNIISQPVGQSVTAGQAASFTVSATGIPDPNYQWLLNGVPISGATSNTYSIASVVRANGGNYSVAVNNGSGTVTSTVAVLTYNNTAPVAASFAIGALLGIPETVTISGVHATDADGDILTVTGVSSAANGTVTTDGTKVTYTATSGSSDSFTYTVNDGFGGVNTGTISVTISSNVANYNQVSAANGGNGTNVLSFLGNPGYNYALDMATNLLPPINWQAQATNQAAIDGTLTFTNLSLLPQTFYRTRLVQ
jgi:pectin methylesterase-like acyl-CoA thioesterase